MLVPILTGLNAMTAADTLCRIEKDASRLAVSESGSGD